MKKILVKTDFIPNLDMYVYSINSMSSQMKNNQK
jgi:hypothetical protein